jgi:hypothetical protein
MKLSIPCALNEPDISLKVMVVEVYRKHNPLGDIITGIVLFYWLGQGLLYLLDVKKPSGGASLGAAVFVIAGLFQLELLLILLLRFEIGPA